MCVVSMIMDYQRDRWSTPQIPMIPTDSEIGEFRKLLERAREYDKQHNEPNCELDEKKQKLLEIAELLGIKEKITFL